MAQLKTTGKSVHAERAEQLKSRELIDLCEATMAAIQAGGGFGWVDLPSRDTLERYWRGVQMVPERMLIIGRVDGEIAGAVQLIRPPANNEAQFFSGQVLHLFVTPWARKRGLGNAMLDLLEGEAWQEGCRLLNLDIRATQLDAIRLFEQHGFVCWGHHPAYAQVKGEVIPGRYYYKGLSAPDAVSGEKA